MIWTEIKRDENGNIPDRQLDQILDSECEQVLLWDSERDIADLFESHDMLIGLNQMREYSHYMKIQIPKHKTYNYGK